MSVAGTAQTAQKLHLDLQWNCEVGKQYPTNDQIQLWAESALDHPDVTAEATIRVVDVGEMQQANTQWRGKPGPTNVLSFPAEFPEIAGINYLGDILICAEVLQRESEEQGKPLHAHWAHIIIHGMLHLQGYDHSEAQDAQVMEGLEISILDLHGYANPYES